jgi:N-methylhydantoinase B/oxoprolinase/acetone carboxylase alpha subunit
MIASFATKIYMEGVAIMSVKLTQKQNCNPNTVILLSEVNKMEV